ncbi:hypothetical protein [Corynebacterium glaucum]|nr:hypothetical protein [Corynebacterium glaucum]
MFKQMADNDSDQSIYEFGGPELREAFEKSLERWAEALDLLADS